MKKADPTSDEELRPEYRREDLGKGVRGKYYKSYNKETKRVLLNPEISAVSATDAVNGTLMSLESDSTESEATLAAKKAIMSTRDYFAELYVAGLMADAGWNIYFPHRDRGLDFIISKTGPDDFEIVRPVQVKGEYPSDDKTDKDVYGYVGRLNQVHPEMVLAIPFFANNLPGPALFVAYMPFSRIKTHRKGYRCQPATFKENQTRPRRDFRRFFNSPGLTLLEEPGWSKF